MSKEVISSEQALAIAKSIKAMLEELQKVSVNLMLNIVPDDEKDHIFVRVNQSKKDKMLVDMQVYNSLTKTIATKSYTIIDLLRNCSNVSIMNTIVESDMKNLYNKSKQCIYKEDTEVFLF